MYSKVSERIDLFIKLQEDERELLDKVQKITDVDYGLESDFLDINDLFGVIKDLVWSYNLLEEKYQDQKQVMEDNYVFNNKNPYVEYGLNEKDF
jgi:hypothetical protein